MPIIVPAALLQRVEAGNVPRSPPLAADNAPLASATPGMYQRHMRAAGTRCSTDNAEHAHMLQLPATLPHLVRAGNNPRSTPTSWCRQRPISKHTAWYVPEAAVLPQGLSSRPLSSGWVCRLSAAAAVHRKHKATTNSAWGKGIPCSPVVFSCHCCSHGQLLLLWLTNSQLGESCGNTRNISAPAHFRSSLVEPRLTTRPMKVFRNGGGH